MAPPHLALAVAAGVLAVGLEAAFKASPSYLARLWAFAPAAMVLNYLIFLLVHTAPSLPAAFIAFGASTLVLRVAVAIAMGQAIGTGTWIACGLMVLAVATKTWRP